jgi:hypothetical protein
MDIRSIIMGFILIFLAVIFLFMSHTAEEAKDHFYARLFFIVALILIVSSVLSVWLLPLGGA